jgi:hypothetical protein
MVPIANGRNPGLVEVPQIQVEPVTGCDHQQNRYGSATIARLHSIIRQMKVENLSAVRGDMRSLSRKPFAAETIRRVRHLSRGVSLVVVAS